MKHSPQLNVTVSGEGVERVEVLYRPSERSAAWRLCERLLPVIESLDDRVIGAATTDSSADSSA